MLQTDQTILRDFDNAIQREWIETNGLGGWASSSIIGCNTRRYHGLLVAATTPPAGRMALVSRLDETIAVNGRRYELSTNQYRGETVHPKGNAYLTKFEKDLFPAWTYRLDDVVLRKTIAMVYGENTTLVKYEVLNAPGNFVLELQPFLSVRNYHSLMSANDAIHRDYHFENGLFRTKAYDGTPEIFIHVPGSTFSYAPAWYYHFNYAIEIYRGLDFEEDLFTHGHFEILMSEGDCLEIILSTEGQQGRNVSDLFAKESLRKQALVNDEPGDELLKQLVLAADQFIVRRDIVSGNGSLTDELKTIIAGYHWFADWGRDTMISLPGLCLSTGRYEDARKIIAAFARSVSMGMLPNRFQDNNEPPEYNNVDGTLWYFIAVHKYLQATNDVPFVLNEILPVLKDIIDWHFRGTRYNIHVDEDGLLYAGEKGQQLTWMDARIGDWVVTPRMGKPVEIQSLWFNCLKIFAELLILNDQPDDAAFVNISAQKAKESFLQKFWNHEAGYLYDVIDENNTPDASLRPNQLFAISLPFALIEGEHARKVLQVVEEKLYVPAGLRSLSPDDPRYVTMYGGDPLKRDSGYHQGTAWNWLLGTFIESILKVEHDRAKALKVVQNFKYHLNEGCIGSVSEITDAEAPYHPRGCVAQAWSVAEMLRVIKEYNLHEQEIQQKIKLATAAI